MGRALLGFILGATLVLVIWITTIDPTNGVFIFVVGLPVLLFFGEIIVVTWENK